MPIIEIDKSVFEEIGNAIEQRDKMYENQIATTKKLTDSIENIYEQEVKKLRNQLQQKENIIKELNDKIEDDKMIIEGNWGCIDNLRKDYNLQKNIIKEVREYIKFLKEHYEELRTSPVEDSYFINDMLRKMFIQSIENYLVGIEDILNKENI